MNEKITDVLNILDKTDNPSQRKIAKETGFSLGLVNILIKKCAQKGLVKIERLNSRNIKYILTAAGIKELTKKTVSYVKRSYQAIQQIQARVKELANQHVREEKSIYILKENHDEIFNLVRSTLNELHIDYGLVNNRDEVARLKDKQNIVIYHWNPELDINCDQMQFVNIFREL